MTKTPVLIAVFALFSCAAACVDPQVTTKSFTTQDATIVTHIAYIAEFTVKCSSGQASALYAETAPGNLEPIGLVGPDTYQASWVEDIKTAKSGERTVKIYNEEGYNTIKRTGKTVEETVEPVFSIAVQHPGAYGGPWVKSEFLATGSFLLVAYLALTTKAKIVA